MIAMLAVGDVDLMRIKQRRLLLMEEEDIHPHI